MNSVQRSAVDTAVEVLVAAFADDPVLRWLLPGGSAAVLFRAAVEGSAAAGEPALDDDVAVAVWLLVPAGPPGPVPTDVPDRVRAFRELTEARHPYGDAHLHLPFLAVRPDRQGRGHGGRLLAERLARADATGLPAYLEASSPRNLPLYERHGFRRHGDPIALPDGPPIRPMWRAPTTPARPES